MALAKVVFPQTRTLLWGIRNVHQSQPLYTDDTSNFSKFYFNLCGYNKYGLLKDDLLNEHNQDIKEAVRRLPEKLKLERAYRCITAFQAEINHSVLPKEQWTKFEDNHNYLQPYLDEVIAERQEREEWEANH